MARGAQRGIMLAGGKMRLHGAKRVPMPGDGKIWPRKLWVEMTTKDFQDLDPRTIAVLPVAAVEQHGPHLPVFVDSCVMQGVTEAVLAILPTDLPVTFLPQLPIGKS